MRTAQPGQPLLTVVVSSYGPDRLAIVEEALQRLRDGGDALRVIVLTNQPEEVAAIVARAAGKVPTEVVDFVGGVSAQRNRGLDRADTPAVALLDDDMVPRPGWLEEALEIAARDDDAIFTGPTLPRAQDPGRACKFLWLHGCRRVDEEGDLESAFGGNLVLTGRARMLRYDERLGPRPNRFVMLEDVDLCHRAIEAGIRVKGSPALSVDHHLGPARLSTRALLSRAHRTGHAGALYLRFVRREGRRAPGRRYLDVAGDLVLNRQRSPFLATEEIGLADVPLLAATSLLWATGFLHGALWPYPHWLRDGARSQGGGPG